MLEDDLVGEVVLHDGVLVPTGRPGRHRVLGAEEPPGQVEALLVAVDDAEHEVRVLGEPQRHPQFTSAAGLVGEVLGPTEGDLLLRPRHHPVHAEDLLDLRLERPAGVVGPEDRARARGTAAC